MAIMRMKNAVAIASLAALFALPATSQLKINGAGATFPYVIYSKWFDLYHTKTGSSSTTSQSAAAAGSSR